MIKPNELRIGNTVTVRHDHRLREVVVISKGWVDLGFPCGAKETYPHDKLMPVKIYPDVMLEYGFECTDEQFDNHSAELYQKGNFRIWFSNYMPHDAWVNIDKKEDGGFNLQPSVEYLHQLQNLYFVLTGHELTALQTSQG
jgi:hypothetical protein